MSRSLRPVPNEMVPHAGPETFDANARDALKDKQLRGALRNATVLFAQRRVSAVASAPDWEGLRTRARAIKDDTLLHLDRYLEQFAANAERAGVQVHWARDAEEACAVIAGIAEAEGARHLVKSKSMATEEIHLNAALARRGLEPVETDLGEWIIQLAGETPSHIVAPAIHKTKGQISELFVEKLGIAPSDDVGALTAAARVTLRDRFAEADLGISGVNFGVAETGTIVIFENEGNARLTTSIPRTHVALMGIEKLVPAFGDLEVFFQLLARSGTGQQLTTYQSILTGPARSDDAEGPRAMHIVLLDNGRSRMLAHPVTRQSLACIRCGACLNACPVYQQIGGHAYGSVYPGPIGIVLTPQLAGLAGTSQLPYASSLCGACREVCPVKIDIPALLLHLRAEVVSKEQGKSRRMERLTFRLYTAAMLRPRLVAFATGVARTMQTLAGEGALAKPLGALAAKLVPPLGAWTSSRDLRPLAERSFREIWADEESAARDEP